MKKYDLSEIMKNAWAIRRMTGCAMSEALRKSWANAKAPKDIVASLLSAGGRRWTKNGHDRIYLSHVISKDTEVSAYNDMSRKVRNTISDMINSVYYDVVNSKLVYKKTPYDSWSWMNEHIENSFKAIAA